MEIRILDAKDAARPDPSMVDIRAGDKIIRVPMSQFRQRGFGSGLSIRVPGFKGDDLECSYMNTQVSVDIDSDGKQLIVSVWDGYSESNDPASLVEIAPE